MKVLLAGYGNVGRAFVSLLRSMNYDISLTICDIKDGNDLFDLLRTKELDADTVINLTGQDTKTILNACLDAGMDYIDSATEFNSDQINGWDCYNDLLATQTNSKVLLGCGMNPGLVEHIYFSHKPERPHIAVELDYDDASYNDEVFNTWSAESYHAESVVDNAFITTRKKPYIEVSQKLGPKPCAELSPFGQKREFMLIPHEEIFSFTRLCPECQASGFFYQAPLRLQNYFREHGSELTGQQLAQIPTLQNVKGGEHVGILFYDHTDDLKYVYNYASHEWAYKRFGVNGTCWQVACGVYTALRLIPLVKRGQVLTMSDLSLAYKNEIDEILADIGFKIEVAERCISEHEFLSSVKPIFQPLL